MTQELYLVVGIQTNYRTLLGNAINTGLQYGFTTRILDLNGLVEKWKTYPNDWEKLGISAHVTMVENLDMFRRLADDNIPRDAIILFLYPPTGELKEAWKILKSKCTNVGMITLSPVPATVPEVSGLRKLGLAKFIKSILGLIRNRAKPSPDIWVVSGSECTSFYSGFLRVTNATQIILTHSIEYELFKYPDPVTTDNFPDSDMPYILVLDQGWFSKPRPEFLSDTQYPPASYNKFKKEICAFLRTLMETSGFEIIVSCHPKASLEATRQLYEGFTVVSSPSSALIRQCKIAIANTSTSIHYALIASKPLILYTNDELSNSIVHPMEAAICKELGIDYVNISHASAIDTVDVCNQQTQTTHQQYLRRYIKQPDAEELPLWDTIYRGLNKLSLV